MIRRGSHHFFTDSTGEELKLGNGRENAIATLETDAGLFKVIESTTRDMLTARPGTLFEDSVDEDDLESDDDLEGGDDFEDDAEFQAAPALSSAT